MYIATLMSFQSWSVGRKPFVIRSDNGRQNLGTKRITNDIFAQVVAWFRNDLKST